MAVFPGGFTMLFDAVLRVGSDAAGNLAFAVELVDRENADAPVVLGRSPLFTDADDAIEWTRRAIGPFTGALRT